MNSFADKIRTLREKRGWSQAELGEKANMAQERISHIENPEYDHSLTVETLIRIADAFDMDLEFRFRRR